MRKQIPLFIPVALFVGLLALFAGQPVQALPAVQVTLEPKAYLPLVLKPFACAPNAQEQQIADLLLNHPDQARASLTCNRILEQVAGERAQDMIDRNYFSHTNPDGYGPNYLVQQAGYVLPAYYGYSLTANYIESIAAGYPTASAAWAGWMDSPAHKSHLLGEIDFYRKQIEYGIGYAYSANSKYGHYWVVIIAEPGP